MDAPRSAVLFFEEDQSVPAGSKPLMLHTMLDCPVLSWAANRMMTDGVRRFFIVCSPRYAQEVRSCFPAGTDVTVSEQHSELMDFLSTPDSVLVLCRAALPLETAGAGFVYQAPGYELQEAWQTRMTNAVSGAALVPGWLPVYGSETLAELEPIFRARGLRP